MWCCRWRELRPIAFGGKGVGGGKGVEGGRERGVYEMVATREEGGDGGGEEGDGDGEGRA